MTEDMIRARFAPARAAFELACRWAPSVVDQLAADVPELWEAAGQAVERVKAREPEEIPEWERRFLDEQWRREFAGDGVA